MTIWTADGWPTWTADGSGNWTADGWVSFAGGASSAASAAATAGRKKPPVPKQIPLPSAPISEEDLYFDPPPIPDVGVIKTPPSAAAPKVQTPQRPAERAPYPPPRPTYAMRGRKLLSQNPNVSLFKATKAAAYNKYLEDTAALEALHFVMKRGFKT